MSSKDPNAEEIRLQTATDLMYGNRDKAETFPFDVKNRFEYLIYSEKLRIAEDGVTPYVSASSRRYQFFSPQAFNELISPKDSNRRNYFERKGLKWTVLHDPYIQAEKEGVVLKGEPAKITGMTLAEKLAKAKRADEVVQEEVASEPTTAKKGGRPKKGEEVEA